MLKGLITVVAAPGDTVSPVCSRPWPRGLVLRLHKPVVCSDSGLGTHQLRFLQRGAERLSQEPSWPDGAQSWMTTQRLRILQSLTGDVKTAAADHDHQLNSRPRSLVPPRRAHEPIHKSSVCVVTSSHQFREWAHLRGLTAVGNISLCSTRCQV